MECVLSTNYTFNKGTVRIDNNGFGRNIAVMIIQTILSGKFLVYPLGGFKVLNTFTATQIC
jgi:hypothetical protein